MLTVLIWLVVILFATAGIYCAGALILIWGDWVADGDAEDLG